MENAVLHRSVKLILRQRGNDPNDVLISCVPSRKVDKALKYLTDEGYDDGPPPSKDIILKEGQILQVHFRGNVKCMSSDTSPRMVFNTYIKSRATFAVEEIDKFAQKSFDCYRGFAQIYTNMIVPSQSQAGAKPAATGQKPAAVEVTEQTVLLTELLISIPKVIESVWNIYIT